MVEILIEVAEVVRYSVCVFMCSGVARGGQLIGEPGQHSYMDKE